MAESVAQSPPRRVITPGRKPSRTTSADAARRWRSVRPSGVLRSRARLRLLRLTNAKAARRASSTGGSGVSILTTSAPMSARSIVQNSPGATRTSSRILIPSRALTRDRSWRAGPASAIEAGRGRDGLPEDRIVAGEDAAADESGQGLQPPDRLERGRRVPDDARDALGVDVLLPVAGVPGQDDRSGLRQLEQQRLVAGRVAVGAEHGHAGGELRVAVEVPPAVAREVEVLPVVEALEEGRRIERRRVLVLLHDEFRLGYTTGAARVVEVQVRQHDQVDVGGFEADRVEAVHEQIRVLEARHRVVPAEPRDRARRHAGVEEDRAVRRLDQVARDRDRNPLGRSLAVEKAGALEPEVAVLERVERGDGHGAEYESDRATVQAPRRRRRALDAPTRLVSGRPRA